MRSSLTSQSSRATSPSVICDSLLTHSCHGQQQKHAPIVEDLAAVDMKCCVIIRNSATLWNNNYVSREKYSCWTRKLAL